MASKQDKWLLRTLRGHTFDDFLNPPGHGVVQSRREISLGTKFSENINLGIPLVSANMDTVTGARMAIALAKQGGIGIIHRYLSIEEEAQKIREVKREENFIISEPYSTSPLKRISEATALMKKRNVGCLMVVDEERKLVGILTSRDMRFSLSDELVSRRMTPRGKLIVAGPKTTLEVAKKLLDKNRLEKIPLVDKDFKLVGLITSTDIENLEKYPLANKDSNGQLIVGAAIGAKGDFLERSAELIKAGVDVIVIDIANSQSVVGEDSVKAFRKRFPDMELVCGNIVLPSYAQKLQSLGVNGIKVGLGPGRACTTRFHTNIGVPQAQAVYECVRSAKVPITADGGIRRDGHLTMALLLGASSAMLGSLFAGTDESPGHVFSDQNGEKYKTFRGMASREAMYEKLISESADDPYETSTRISPEGMEMRVKYKGSVVPIIQTAMDHLASAISYLGARSLTEAKDIFMKNPQKYLIKLSQASKEESFNR